MLSNIPLIIENCLIGGAWTKPETLLTDRPEIFKTENSIAPYEFMNAIFRTNFTHNPDAMIEEQFRDYFEKGIRFRWYVHPHSQPKDLADKLKAKNPSALDVMCGLYCETNSFTDSMPEGVTVEELCEANLDDYTNAMIDGWGQSGAEAERVRGEIKRDFESGKMAYRTFLSRYRGEPASTGGLRFLKEGGYLFGGNSRPHLRGRGAYAGLVRYRVRLLKDLGIPYCFIAARKETSAPICLKLGFQQGCELLAFTFSPPKAL